VGEKQLGFSSCRRCKRRGEEKRDYIKKKIGGKDVLIKGGRGHHKNGKSNQRE